MWPDLVAEHLDDNDEILLHVLTARVRDWAIEEFEDGDRNVAERIVRVYERGLTYGDERVENAVSVSFIEDTPLWDPARSEFIESRPEPLRSEAERQRNWRAYVPDSLAGGAVERELPESVDPGLTCGV